MSDESSFKRIGAHVRTLQIIVIALSTGVISFGAFVLSDGGDGQPAEPSALTVAAVFFTIFGIAMGVVVPSLMTSAQRKRIADGTWRSANPQVRVPDSDAGKLLAVYQTKTIIRAALFEGPAFLALFAYMSEGHPASLGMAALSLIGLILQFPTVGRVEQWVEGQLELIEEHRQFS